MILLIDNYDSFVFNLARYCAKLGYDYEVVRNDAVTVEHIEALKPDAIIISPGPCTPATAGISKDVISHFADIIPILGVCLGHQSIAECFGGKTVLADKPWHGKTSQVNHQSTALFQNIPTTFDAARYHSLVIELPSNAPFNVTARSDDGIIMAIEHTEKPIYGIQFHPESILTPHGMGIVKNFLMIADIWNEIRENAA